MDIWKKFFSKSNKELNSPWFDEEEEKDDFEENNKFFFEIFTNPLDINKHFEEQLQEMLKALHDDASFGEVLEDENRKSNFEKVLKKGKKEDISINAIPDRIIHTDHLPSLLQRLSPNIQKPMNTEKPNKKTKLRDEEIIMGRIHGTLVNDDESVSERRNNALQKIPRHFESVFDGGNQGPKIFRQSIITQTIRKPDGSYETRKTVRDIDGSVKTTTTRSINGKTEIITESDTNSITLTPSEIPQSNYWLNIGRNIYMTSDGYVLPKNLW